METPYGGIITVIEELHRTTLLDPDPTEAYEKEQGYVSLSEIIRVVRNECDWESQYKKAMLFLIIGTVSTYGPGASVDRIYTIIDDDVYKGKYIKMKK